MRTLIALVNCQTKLNAEECYSTLYYTTLIYTSIWPFAIDNLHSKLYHYLTFVAPWTWLWLSAETSKSNKINCALVWEGLVYTIRQFYEKLQYQILYIFTMTLLSEAHCFQIKVFTAKFSKLFFHPTKHVHDRTVVNGLLQNSFYFFYLDWILFSVQGI